MSCVFGKSSSASASNSAREEQSFELNTKTLEDLPDFVKAQEKFTDPKILFFTLICSQ